jgi:hypothetical protein
MIPNCIQVRSFFRGSIDLRFYLLLALSLTFVSASVQGQYYSPPMTVRTPYGNVTTPGTWRPAPYYGNTGPAKYKFTIVLKNYPDSVLEGRSAIYTDEAEDIQYLKFRSKGQKIRITPEDTRQISRILVDTHERYVGFATDSCWLFRSVEGRIDGYSSAAEKGYTYVIAIQQGDGPILPLTKENLEPMIKDHPKAMQYFEKKKLTAAVKAFNKPVPSNK